MTLRFVDDTWLKRRRRGEEDLDQYDGQ